MSVRQHLDGPYFDDLHVGQVLPPAPAVTIGPGETAAYQAICGDPLAIACSRPLAEAVTGEPGQVVNPALVLQFSIGQSTVATRRVIANLFYRGVRLARTVRVGDTMSTTVEVRGMRENRRRPDRPPRGSVLLGIRTTDQEGRVVADYERCPMLGFRGTDETGNDDDIGGPDVEADLAAWTAAVPPWDLGPLAPGGSWAVGEARRDPMRDTVTDALALVRLTQNQAAAHRDPALGLGGRRLVYGGHTIGLAQASLSRLLPSLATVLGWVSCDHTGPVFEGDVLGYEARLDAVLPVDNGVLMSMSVHVEAERDGITDDVLHWRPVVLAAA